jgi:fructuronate reductase
MTDDARPWEQLKLRALNGVHSALAYLGALAGVETIAESMRIPCMREVLGRLLAEDVAASFAPPAGVSVAAYGESVFTRFANPAIGHRTLQVAMDGTQKLPQRILHTISDRRSAGAAAPWASLVVAAWMRFAQGRADDGRRLDLDDPLADRVRQVLTTADSPRRVVTGLLGLDSVFPAELAADDTVVDDVTGWLASLTRHGVRATLVEAARS